MRSCRPIYLGFGRYQYEHAFPVPDLCVNRMVNVMNGEVTATMVETALARVGWFLSSSILQQQEMLIAHYFGVIWGDFVMI